MLAAGTCVCLLQIEGGCAFFEDFACALPQIRGCLIRVEGEHLPFNMLGKTWLEVAAVFVKGLRNDVQPTQLNQYFRHVWKSMLSQRTPSCGRVRVVPKKQIVLAGRPLGDQSRNPTAILCRLLARFLDVFGNPPLALAVGWVRSPGNDCIANPKP